MPSDLLAPPENEREGYDDEFQKMQGRGQMGDDPESNSSEALSPDELEAAESNTTDEAGATDDTESSALAPSFKYKKDSGAKKRRGLSKNKTLLFAGGGGGVLVGLLLVMFLIVGQLKVVSFGNVLATTGYLRFNGIMQQRMTQDIFDASVSQGDSTTSLRNRTVRERITGQNLNNELSRLGREDQFKLSYEGNELKNVKIGSKNISLDGVSKELGFGDSYSKAGLRERLTVRKAFTERTQSAVGETFSTESKYLRSKAFGTISDNVGFKFSRWRQSAREYFGKTALEGDVKNKVDTQEQVGGEKTIETNVEVIDEPVKSAKSKERLKAFLEKNGGTFDESLFEETIAKDTASAAKFGEIATKAGQGTLVLSLVCMAHEASLKIPEVYNQNVQTAQRQGLLVAATRDQIKSGNVTSEAVGAASKQLDGADSSQYYQAATGQSIDGGGNIPHIKPRFSPTFLTLIRNLTDPKFLPPGVTDKVCEAILSPQGAITAAVAEVVFTVVVGTLTGGAAAAAEQGGSRVAVTAMLEALKEATFASAKGLVSRESVGLLAGVTAYSFGLQYITNILGGTSISGAQEGADYYNTAALGTTLQQNNQMQTLYGRPLSASEAGNSDQYYAALSKNAQAEKGFANHYFALSNPYSLTNNAVMRLPTSFTNAATMARSSLTKLGSIFQPQTYLSSLARPTGQVAYAASGFDPYQGNTQLGFSPSEREKIQNDDSYSISKNLDRISDAEITAYDIKYAQCFDPTTKPWDLLNLQADGGICSAQELSQDSVFRYRLYKLDVLLGDQVNASFSDGPHDLTGNGSALAGAGGGGIGINADGFVFPLKTTKSTLKSNTTKWCYTSLTNCHHDYNAADIFAPSGTIILAARAGVVTSASYSTQFGQNVSIKGDDGLYYYYTHMPQGKNTVKVGDRVTAGQQIGEVGTPANANGTAQHLHIDIIPQKRPSCSAAACTQYPFINVQPVLTSSFDKLPE